MGGGPVANGCVCTVAMACFCATCGKKMEKSKNWKVMKMCSYKLIAT